MLIKKQLDS
jgi:multidrug resistance efflux pump